MKHHQRQQHQLYKLTNVSNNENGTKKENLVLLHQEITRYRRKKKLRKLELKRKPNTTTAIYNVKLPEQEFSRLFLPRAPMRRYCRRRRRRLVGSVLPEARTGGGGGFCC